MMNRMRKFAVLVMALAVFALLCGVAGAESGTCGENLAWSLENGTLTITGTGAMTDFGYNGAPWYDIRNSITSVDVGSGVTSIGNFAFTDCHGLTGFTIPEGVTRIGDNAFDNCDHLASITIPYGMTSIGDSAFYKCESLTGVSLPASITEIKFGAFCYSGLKSVTIPAGMTSIGDYVFSNCNSLVSVTIPNSVTRIGDSAFCDCGFTGITIPNSVTYFGYYAFSYCPNLTEFTIPASVTTIKEGAFSGCEKLTNLRVASGSSRYTVVNGVLFNAAKTQLISYPSALTAGAYTVPDGVTEIRMGAFDNCTNLVRITLPGSVTSIDEDAFYGSGSILIEAPCTSYAITWAINHQMGFRKIHSMNAHPAVKETCTKAGNRAYWACGTCGGYFSDEIGKTEIAKDSWVIAKKGHKWKKPTYTWSLTRKSVTAIQVCAHDISHRIIEMVKTTYKVVKEPTYTKTGIGQYTTRKFTKSKDFKVQTKKVTLATLPRTSITKAKLEEKIPDQVYTGKQIRPKFELIYNKIWLSTPTDYKVSYKNNVNIGVATITVEGRNEFRDTKEITFKINPAPVKKFTVTAAGKDGKITLKWNKITEKSDGYTVDGFTITCKSLDNDKFKPKTKNVKKKNLEKYEFKWLWPGTYQVEIRAYKTVKIKDNGKTKKETYYSPWTEEIVEVPSW